MTYSQERPEVTMLITSLISGKKDRYALKEALQMPDRRVREVIEDARNAGYMIINDGDGTGYYIAQSIEDIKRYYRIEKARAMSITKRLEKVEKLLEERGYPT